MVRRAAWVLFAACSGAASPQTTPSNRAEPRAPVSVPVSPPDADDDGIPDASDRCPHEPEDYDAFEDDDGCPDPDNDRDGVLDAADNCPYQAGPVANRGCVTPCSVFVSSTDDCFFDPTVFYGKDGVPQPDRVAEIVALVRAHPTVRELIVVGTQADLVARSLGAQLPQTAISIDRRDSGTPNAVTVMIAKQRFDAGHFRAVECTPFGAIYSPARQDNCTL
jgi:hypothetical protein